MYNHQRVFSSKLCLLHFCIKLYVTYMLLSASVCVFFRQLFWCPPCMYALACILCYHGQSSELMQCWHHILRLFIETDMFSVFLIMASVHSVSSSFCVVDYPVSMLVSLIMKSLPYLSVCTPYFYSDGLQKEI
jgi:hypothetical protein